MILLAWGFPDLWMGKLRGDGGKRIFWIKCLGDPEMYFLSLSVIYLIDLSFRNQFIMYSPIVFSTLLASAYAQTQYTSTGTAAVEKARATALTLSPTSNVVGNTFNRFVTIWCENTDYSIAAADRSSLLSPLSFPQNPLTY